MMIALRSAVLRFTVVPALAAFALVACSGNDKSTGVADAKLPQGARPEKLSHEACDESGNRVEVLDTNTDGKDDIRRVYDKKSGHEICRIADLNHDGKPDLYEYFDAGGVVRRRELCFGESGVVDAIETFEAGKLVRREYDTTGQHRIDTWDYFDPAQPPDSKGRMHPVRRERDTTGDGHIDQWWTFEGQKVTIAMDKSGDGKPDPEATVVLGGGGEDAGAAPTPAAATDAGAPSTAATDASGPAPIATSPDGGESNAKAAVDGGKP